MTSIRLPALFLLTSILTLTAAWMFPARADEPVAAVQDWPMWSGPTANWLASPDEKGLIADLNQAKMLWTSEDKACGGVRGQSRRYGGQIGIKPSAGGASPIVYRDKVYFYFLEPKGAVSSNISYNHDPHVMAEQFLADPKLVSQGFNKEQFLDDVCSKSNLRLIGRFHYLQHYLHCHHTQQQQQQRLHSPHLLSCGVCQ